MEAHYSMEAMLPTCTTQPGDLPSNKPAEIKDCSASCSSSLSVVLFFAVDPARVVVVPVVGGLWLKNMEVLVCNWFDGQLLFELLKLPLNLWDAVLL